MYNSIYKIRCFYLNFGKRVSFVFARKRVFNRKEFLIHFSVA